ncbi:tyrosine-type recombinase/integrase [Nonomuraea sp. NPDC003754]
MCYGGRTAVVGALLRLQENGCYGQRPRPARHLVQDGTAWPALFEDGTPHDLRHSQETWLGDERIAQKTINKRMGHKTKKTKMIYTHVTDEMKRQISDALERRLWAAVGELAAVRPVDGPLLSRSWMS